MRAASRGSNGCSASQARPGAGACVPAAFNFLRDLAAPALVNPILGRMPASARPYPLAEGDDQPRSKSLPLRALVEKTARCRPDVLEHITELQALGISVVFVSNAGTLRPEALAALKPVCAGIIVRRNVGYDFGAWREALDALRLPRPGHGAADPRQ